MGTKSLVAVPVSEPVAIEDDFKIPFLLDAMCRNSNFTGRKMALEQLHEYVTTSKRISRISPVVSIYGLGGVGKTQLALEYAYRNQDRFHAVFWINAWNIRSVHTSFLKAAQRIIRHYASKHGGQDPPYADISRHLGLEDMVNESGDIETDGLSAGLLVDAVREWLGRDGNTEWLLIFDGSDGLEYAELSNFFPDSLVGHIIITSRRRPMARSFQEVELGAMNQQEACKLILNSSGSSESETGKTKLCCAPFSKLCLTFLADFEAGVRIVQTLGYFPLAISQAASYISKVGVSFRTYLRLLECEMEKRTGSDRAPLAALRNYPLSVRDTWEMSLGALEAHDPPAAHLLHLCSYFAHDNIPVEMLFLGMPQDPHYREFTPHRN